MQLIELELAYIRRQRWLARLQAVEVARVLFGDEKMTKKSHKTVTLDGLMGQMGTKWE